MKKITIAALLCLICMAHSTSWGQSVGIGTLTPDSSAKLEVQSTGQGFLPPRMTFAQRNAISNPAQGLMIYCLDCDTCGQMQVYSGARWCNMIGAAAAPPSGATCSFGVRICNQVWSERNLDVATYRNGDTIPEVTDPATWGTLTTGAWCWYNNDPSNGAVYGRLYNWYAVDDPRGLAPTGWRIPTEHDWNVLVKCLDNAADTTTCTASCTPSTIAGGAMKKTGFDHWIAPNTGATNSSGFNALPGGFINQFSGFSNLQFAGIFWSATALDNTFAFMRNLQFNGSFISKQAQFKKAGFSVRVIRD